MDTKIKPRTRDGKRGYYEGRLAEIDGQIKSIEEELRQLRARRDVLIAMMEHFCPTYEDSKYPLCERCGTPLMPFTTHTPKPATENECYIWE